MFVEAQSVVGRETVPVVGPHSWHCHPRPCLVKALFNVATRYGANPMALWPVEWTQEFLAVVERRLSVTLLGRLMAPGALVAHFQAVVPVFLWRCHNSDATVRLSFSTNVQLKTEGGHLKSQKWGWFPLKGLRRRGVHYAVMCNYLNDVAEG